MFGLEYVNLSCLKVSEMWMSMGYGVSRLQLGREIWANI